MAEGTEGAEGSNSSAGSGEEGQSAGGTENLEGQSGNEIPQEGQSQEGEEATSGEEGDENPFIKDKDGKEFISREAFEKRVAKLTAQKHDASSLIESLRSDPVVRADFIKSLNLEEGRTPSPKDTENTEPSSFDKFIAPFPPEHQAHYRGLMQAISPIFEDFMQTKLEEAMKPVRSYIGEQRVKSFAQTNPDYAKHEKQVAELIQSGRARSLEDAYKIASFEARLKGAGSAGAKAEADRRAKLNKAPIAGKERQAIQTKGKSPNSLHEAIMKSASEVGWGQQ